MTTILGVVAVTLVLAVMYARVYSIEDDGFSQHLIPRAKKFVEEFKRGASGVGIAPCEGCGYAGSERRFRHVSGLYLCGECRTL